MNQKKADDIRQNVRASYSQVAEASNSGDCCGETSSCCGVSSDDAINTLVSTRLGYSEDDLASVPKGADMGLGCGNPRAIASIKLGETIVDLGSGGGFDCFLAAAETGEQGRVIGVDMTPTMISKARDNADRGKYNHVEFRLGEIENLPVANDIVDVIISNCVINLSPNKARVFEETFRVLKTGGRLAISDVVASTELPDEIREDLQLYSGCMAGASLISELETILANCGFTDIKISPKDASKEFIKDWAPGRGVEDYVLSASIEAVKPGGCCGGACC
ncbi:MAG: arsenite methyltransferase [Gammaproteobacteria bacterium]|nr:arsenite methyltransferase [Gammaproteobacteria bacterium]MCK5262854.1 arsenite methyltransferase [Gammaproteobacteria bacterium]